MEIDSFTVIVGDTSTSLSIKDRKTQQNISKETQELNNTLNQLNLRDIERERTTAK